MTRPIVQVWDKLADSLSSESLQYVLESVPIVDRAFGMAMYTHSSLRGANG